VARLAISGNRSASGRGDRQLSGRQRGCRRRLRVNYYGHFYRTQLRPTLKRIDAYVIRWVAGPLCWVIFVGAMDAGKDGEMIMSNNKDTEKTRELSEEELNHVTGGDAAAKQPSGGTKRAFEIIDWGFSAASTTIG
jgi:bacteriocin-like protein